MALVEYVLKENVAVVTWNSGENRFNPAFMSAHLEVMDEILSKTEAQTVVVRSAHEKIWCNGIDLDYLSPLLFNGEKELTKAFCFQLDAFYKSLLLSPLVTVACINGHAFAGGAMAACAFDFRFMRSDRGFLCLPEVDLSMRFFPSMMALLKKAIPLPVLHDMVLTGRRMTAAEGQAAGIVRKACGLDTLESETLAFALAQKKQRKTVGAIKQDLYQEVIKAINEWDPPFFEVGALLP